MVLMMQTRDFGGFLIAFHYHRLHGRDRNHHLSATAQGFSWIEAFHY